MSATRFTDTQGQYLAFIDAYTRVHGRPPAESDMQRHFGVSPPSVHQMVLTLERLVLIRRQPGVARMNVLTRGSPSGAWRKAFCSRLNDQVAVPSCSRPQ